MAAICVILMTGVRSAEDLVGQRQVGGEVVIWSVG